MYRSFRLCIWLLSFALLLPVFGIAKSVKAAAHSFPYAAAGLTRQQAAAHLLGRFTFGIRPGQLDQVLNLGMETWFAQQLNASLPDDTLNERLKQYDALSLTNMEIVNRYPRGGQLLKMAIKDSLISKDSVTANGRKEYKDILDAYMKDHGFRPEQDLYRQLISQKIVRAVYTNNQLQEVLTDFWFNHFNVALVKNDCARFILSYERDAIRPNALGNFSDLLLATAQSPAMLYYLDNFSSVGADTKFAQVSNKPPVARNDTMQAVPSKKKQLKGLNENYAREVMELHTLGVTGGYLQKDVTEAARILTGWTVYPMGDYGNSLNQQKKMTRDSAKMQGFIHHGDFVFDPARHDKGEKVVLGKIYPANGGYEEGVELLTMLAHRQATAQFICHKLAVRFVSDNPPKKLVDRMAAAFMKENGSIRAVLLTMVNSPEFWKPAAVRAKTKSPFELAISSVRTLNVDVQQPYQLFTWMSRMGQRIYYYQAPTGFPDKSQYWINSGALLNRMNFGLALATGRIPGVKPNLPALNNGHEPESPSAALSIYSGIMLPGRDLTATTKQLAPMLTDPDLVQKVSTAANASSDNTNTPVKPIGNKEAMLPKVVGVIIGAPEFQRR